MSDIKVKKERAFELDALRGVAIVMMMFMHMSYDVRYEFGIKVFEYLHKASFWVFVHPIIVVLFVGLSGICCTFSRNNLIRGLKLLGVALAFTVGTFIATKYMGIYCLIIFNVLHLLSVSILIYAGLSFIEKKAKIPAKIMTLAIGFIALYIMMMNNELSMFDYSTDNMLFIPVGFTIDGEPPVADYMPLIPWVGVFLSGVVMGRTLYPEKKTLFPDANETVKKILSPLSFMGRHSLIIYIVHQPIIYGLLYAIFFLLGKV